MKLYYLQEHNINVLIQTNSLTSQQNAFIKAQKIVMKLSHMVKTTFVRSHNLNSYRNIS